MIDIDMINHLIFSEPQKGHSTPKLSGYAGYILLLQSYQAYLKADFTCF